PYSSTQPKSPVCNQPSSNVSFVLASLFQYPCITSDPLQTISPTSPTDNSFHSSSITFISTKGPALPHDCKRSGNSSRIIIVIHIGASTRSEERRVEKSVH